MKNNIIVNTRCLFAQLTGVQRYTKEILVRGNGYIETSPLFEMPQGGKGHLWEQFFLPFTLKDNLLWNPANTGPLLIKNQIVTIHDVAVLEHPEWFAPNFSKWYRFLLPKLAQRVKKIITVSEFSRKRIVDTCNVNENKIISIYNAVDERFSKKNKEEVNALKTSLGIKAEHYILALSSLEPRKNLKRLLNAWDLVQSELPDDLWLVISGAKGKNRVFQDVSFATLPPRVHLTGYVPDEYLPALYSGAQAFVYPSLYEGFGLPPLEAMACGTPVIVSNTTSLPEVVGNAGILVDPLDVNQIADAIQRVVTNDKLQLDMREKGLARAKLFSWDKTAKQTWQVLQEAAEQNK